MSTISNRIKTIRKENRLSQTDFGLKIGVTRSVINNIELNRNKNGVPDNIIKLIAVTFSVNEKWLKTGNGKPYIQTSETILNELQKKYTLDNLDINIIETYLKLEPAQRRAIKEYISKLADSISENKTDSSVSHKNVVSIRTHKTLYYDMPVSAGTGNPLEDEYPEEIELMEKPPKGTDFIVRVAGNSMEPTYYNNNRLFVKEQPEVENGEIGIFVINGNAYVKEFGGDKLISHNEAFPDIAFNEYNTIKCCGKVLGICKENF